MREEKGDPDDFPNNFISLFITTDSTRDVFCRKDRSRNRCKTRAATMLNHQWRSLAIFLFAFDCKMTIKMTKSSITKFIKRYPEVAVLLSMWTVITIGGTAFAAHRLRTDPDVSVHARKEFPDWHPDSPQNKSQ